MRSDDDDIWQPVFWNDPINWLIEWLHNKPNRWRYRYRFRHNPAPEPDFQPVMDKQRRTYWLNVYDDELMTVLRIFYCGEEIGRTNAVWLEDSGQLNISDLEIDPKHQGRKLGAILIEQLNILARRRGAAQITGRIVEKDRMAFPGLLAWYQQHGFTVEPVVSEAERGDTHDIAHIERAVSSH